jgi:multiple sugar transport system substrate-binding protein
VKRKRLTSYVAAVAALSLGVAACGDDAGDNGAADGEEVTLVWAIGGAEAQPGGIHQEIAQKYSDETDGVTVEIDILPEAADEQRQQQSLELNAEGDGFDILGVDVIWTGEYSENGWLASLEDVRSEIEDVTLPGPFQSATWGGELWAGPYNSNAGFLFYRTDLVDEPPTTWDELKDVGLAAAEEAGINGFVGQGAQYEGFVVNWLEYFWGAGGELYNEDQSAVEFDPAVATEVTEWLEAANNDGLLAPGFNTMMEEEARNEFQSGNAVFMRNWPYAYSLGQDEDESEVAGNFDIAPLPTFTGDGTISALGGFNNAVSAFSSNVDAAIDFVVWASTNEEVQTMLAEDSLPPTLASVYDDLQDDPVMALLGEVLADAKPRPPAPDWNSISVEIQQNMFPAYNGNRDASDASENVRDFLEGTIQ